MTEFTDITYEVDNGLAWITINRPERYNAFRARTLDELIRAFKMAWASSEVGVICLTGAGEKAFCTGGDQKQRAETGDYGPSETGLFEVDTLHRVIRDVSSVRHVLPLYLRLRTYCCGAATDAMGQKPTSRV